MKYIKPLTAKTKTYGEFTSGVLQMESTTPMSSHYMANFIANTKKEQGDEEKDINVNNIVLLTPPATTSDETPSPSQSNNEGSNTTSSVNVIRSLT